MIANSMRKSAVFARPRSYYEDQQVQLKVTMTTDETVSFNLIMLVQFISCLCLQK